MGAITTLHAAVIKIPETVSMMGFDDILAASTNNPPLTTVRQSLNEMERVAASTLLRLILHEPINTVDGAHSGAA